MRADPQGGSGPGQNMRFSDIVIDDPNISLAAKGLFSTLGLMGSSCSVAILLERTSDGEEVLRGALDELVRAGYVEIDNERVRVQSTGSFGVTE